MEICPSDFGHLNLHRIQCLSASLHKKNVIFWELPHEDQHQGYFYALNLCQELRWGYALS